MSCHVLLQGTFTWKLSGRDKLAEFLQDPDRYYDPRGYTSPLAP